MGDVFWQAPMPAMPATPGAPPAPGMPGTPGVRVSPEGAGTFD